MLDPWIIEEIKKREEEKRREQEAGRVELPLEPYEPRPVVPRPNIDEEVPRGIVVIDM